ncbi:hypothetical protein [Roseibium album]|uniref:hypothetical protein n=1 Tax=Roseibium album TaxID=311410 RepID=UPI00391AE1AA
MMEVFPSAVRKKQTHRIEDTFSVQCFLGTPCSNDLRLKISADLAVGMPSFRVESYFLQKASLFENDAITIVIHDKAADTVVGVIIAAYLDNPERETLNIRTILIVEEWHRRNVINLLWRNLFKTILCNGRSFPKCIVFKTYSPKSFQAMAVFSRIPGVEMYPSLEKANTAKTIEHIRKIAEILSPEHRLVELTGVLKGASDGVNDFYSDLPLSGRSSIDDHFKQNLTQSDRLLCCLFVDTQSAANRILRAFGS